MCITQLFIFIFSFYFSISPYRIVLVDSFTRKPLDGVLVQTSEKTEYSDSNGVVIFPSRPQKIRLSHIGYSSTNTLLSTREGIANVDTFGLFPKPILLADAIVNSHQINLSTTSKDYKSPYRYATNLLIPGHKVAVVYQRPNYEKSYFIREIQLHFIQKFNEGRIMIKVVALNDGGKPSDRSLLPDSILTSNQLHHIKNEWTATIDVSKYDLLIPERGIAVVVECLTSVENEKIVGTHKIDEKENTYRMMVDTEISSSGKEISRITSFVDYPQLSTSMQLVAQSWVWRQPASQWTLNKWGVINQNGQYMGNPVISLLVNQL